jgi:hypothetical protein
MTQMSPPNAPSEPSHPTGWWLASDGKWYPPQGNLPPPPAPPSSDIPAVAWAMLVGAGLLIVGSFLPWLKATAPLVGTLTKSGTEGSDGWITFGIGVVVAIQAAQVIQKRSATRRMAVELVLVALLVGGIAFYEFRDISHRFADIKAQTDLVTTSYGVGLYCIVAAAVALLVGGLKGVEKH